MDNFGFLEKPFPSLANLGRLAEKYRASDPHSSLIKMGLMGETGVRTFCWSPTRRCGLVVVPAPDCGPGSGIPGV